MAPQSPVAGLIVSKLGVEATASGDIVRGLLCLKISISDGPRSRHVLINGSEHFGPHPIILPLPLSTDDTKDPEVSTALTLLALPSTSGPASRPAVTPYIELAGGQVSIAMNSQRTVRSRNPVELNKSAPTSRQDWLVILPFELRVTSLSNGFSHILLPLPKCLDNVLRYQITSEDPDAPLRDVSIMTDPKILPMPSSSFDSSLKTTGVNGTPRGKLADWNDANSSEGSGSENDVDTEGSWLQGRFQSTDALSLEWSISGPPSASSSLTVEPQWHTRKPTIHVHFESTIPTTDQVIPLEAILPDGWGWSSLSMSGDDLVRWRSVDGGFWNEAVSSGSLDMTAPSMSHAGTSRTALGSESDEDDDLDLDLDHIEDSFTTLRNRSRPRKGFADNTYLPTPPASSSSRLPRQSTMPRTPISTSNASLLRQAMPRELEKMDDFSFEMNSVDDEPPLSPRLVDTPRRSNGSSYRPALTTPRATPPSSETSHRGSGSSSRRQAFGTLRTEKLFDLEFSDGGTEARTFTLQGTLAPLPLTLVSPSLPTDIPFVNVDHSDASTSCSVQSPLAYFGAQHHVFGAESRTEAECDTSARSIGTFRWHGDARLLSAPNHPIQGPVKVVLQRQDMLGNHIRVNLSIPLARASQEVALTLPGTDRVKIIRATVAGTDMPRAVARITDGEATTSEIRVGTKGRNGTLDISLEVSSDFWDNDDVILPLPILEGNGEMTVDLRGDWGASRSQFFGNFIDKHLDHQDRLRFVFPLSTVPRLSISTRVKSGSSQSSDEARAPSSINRRRSRTLLSWTTLLNLLLLWLVLSMGQQVQRLRTELAFVVDETRDLRLYGLHSQPPPMDVTAIPAPESSAELGEAGSMRRNDLVNVDSIKMSTAVGRVVFGDSAWRTWANHPTVQTVGRGVEWIWRAVVWLLAPG